MYLGTLFPIAYILMFLMSFDKLFTKIFLQISCMVVFCFFFVFFFFFFLVFNSLVDTWFTNIFSYLRGCLFMLLLISLAVQKLGFFFVEAFQIDIAPLVYFLFCPFCFCSVLFLGGCQNINQCWVRAGAAALGSCFLEHVCPGSSVL